MKNIHDPADSRWESTDHGRLASYGSWQADSYHIYGRDIAATKARLSDRMESAPFENRIYELTAEMIQEIYQEAESAVQLRIADYDRSH